MVANILVGKSRGQLPPAPDRKKPLGQRGSDTQLWMCLGQRGSDTQLWVCLGQRGSDTQLWMCLVVKVESGDVKNSIEKEPVMLGP